MILLGCVQGALSTLSLAPFNFPLLAWLAPWPLFYFAWRFAHRPKLLLASGAISSLWLCIFSFYWMLYLFQEFGGLPLPLSLLIFVPYTVLLNLKSPLFVLLFGLLHRQRFRVWAGPKVLAAAVLGLFTDFLTPQIFPWYWGNLLAGNPWFVQWAEFGGVYVLSLFLFGGSYALYRLVGMARLGAARRLDRVRRLLTSRSRLLRVGPVLALLLLGLLLGAARRWQFESRQAGLPTVRVATVQPNAPLEKAGQAEITQSVLRRLMREVIPDLAARAVAAGNGRVDLIVLPESAVPYYSAEENAFTRGSGYYSVDFERMVTLLALRWKSEVFFNEIAIRAGRNALGEFGPLAYNSSALYTREGRRQATYAKQKLLAFGEYVPGVELLQATGLIQLVPGVVRGARFEPGRKAQLLPYSRANRDNPQEYAPGPPSERTLALPVRELHRAYAANAFSAYGRFAPLICYEVLSPELVRDFFLRNTEAPDFLVNITQDGWYGKTVETYQHFELGRIRAVETRRALVRATNSGSSGFVDVAGNYARPLAGPTFTPQEAVSFQVWDVPIHRGGPTLYVRFGNTWLWLPALLWCGAFWWRRRKRVAAG